MLKLELFDADFKTYDHIFGNIHVNHVRIEYEESMQEVLNLKLTYDYALFFNCDSALLLMSVVAHSFWNIKELGEATEFLFSVAIAA